MLEYERTQDIGVLKNTIYTMRRTFVGYGTDNIDKYNTLLLDHNNKNLVFTDFSTVEDMDPITETLQISKVKTSKSIEILSNKI